MAARVFDVVLHLLDHQIIDADGGLAGNVDDAEIRIEADGSATVVALLSGPGVLAQRTGHTRYGAWRERLDEVMDPGTTGQNHIRIAEVREFGTGIRINRRASEFAAYGTERWVREHVIGHIPGARHGG